MKLGAYQHGLECHCFVFPFCEYSDEIRKLCHCFFYGIKHRYDTCIVRGTCLTKTDQHDQIPKDLFQQIHRIDDNRFLYLLVLVSTSLSRDISRFVDVSLTCTKVLQPDCLLMCK